jgi:hypothetical protein
MRELRNNKKVRPMDAYSQWRENHQKHLYVGMFFAQLIILVYILFIKQSLVIIDKIAIFIIFSIPILIIYKKYFKVIQRLANSTKNELTISRMHSIGVYDINIEPKVDDYKRILDNAHNGFDMMGIGADKVTRDFDTFRLAMSRCSSVRPVRFLLIAPDIAWVNESAIRQGLVGSNFKERIIRSLKLIAKLHNEYSIPVEVRFYRTKPIFRVMITNNDECWLGYYCDSVVSTGQNEFESKGNSSLILKRPSNRPQDREFFGVAKAYFEQQWDMPGVEKWDFTKYLT